MRPLIFPVLALLGLHGACSAPERSGANLEASPLAEPAGPPRAATPAAGAPTRVPLAVRETAGVARAGEVVRSGVPLPRSLGVHDPRSLAVLGPDGKPVPAEFHTLARWNAGKDDAAAPIQWVLVVFPATVAARGSATYTLVADGSAGPNPPPPAPLRLSRQGEQVVVETGAATFRLGGKPGELFDEIALPDGKKIVSGGGMTLRTAAAEGGHSTLRAVRIESQGPLSAVVVIEGAYDLPPVGGGQLGSRRRYVFTAGSPTAVVRHAVAWEGDLGCTGCLKTKEGRPDGVLVERARDALTLDLGAAKPAAATVVGAFREPALEAAVGAAGEDGSDLAALRQTLRDRRAAPLHFEMTAGGQRRAGKQADGGLLAVSGPAGSIAVAIDHMHRYEPQALRLLADGHLAVDLADGKAWLANHQGMFATLAVTVLPGAAKRADLDRLVWAPLNRPLRAWPDAAWFTALRGGRRGPRRPAPQEPRGLRRADPAGAEGHHRRGRRRGARRADDLRRLPALLGAEGGAGRDRLQGRHDAGGDLGRHLLVRHLDRLPQYGRDLGALGDALGGGRVARRARASPAPCARSTPRSCSAPLAIGGSTAARRPPATTPTGRTSTAPTPISKTFSSTTG